MRRLPLILVLALFAALPAIPHAGAVGDVNDTLNIRLPAGANDPARIALRFSQATFADGGAAAVLLATQESFADALSSGTLQGDDTPLLLTSSDNLRADVARELDRLGASQVTLLGGTAALTENVADELRSRGLTVTRVAGGTRVQTAVQVADMAAESTTALVARAYGDADDESRAFADSLAAASLAADNGWPSLLTDGTALSPETKEALAESSAQQIWVLGGPAAISDEVVAELGELGIEVIRVAGANRFQTALEIARRRGFETAADAEQVILAEGQAADAWAAGFSAAAFAAANDAPIVLANGPNIPPETAGFLASNNPAFAVDVDEVDSPVLICAADPAACDQARVLLGLPPEADIVVPGTQDGIPSRSIVPVTVDLHGQDADVTVFGPCVDDGLVQLTDGAFDLEVNASPGTCPLEFLVEFANGTVQEVPNPIVVLPALPLTGVVIDTETGGDAYTFVPAGRDAAETINYLPQDTFRVDGELATIGAFEAALTVADQVTFTADTAEGEVHAVSNVDPATINEGTLGDVDLAARSLAIIEPVTGTPLRPDLTIGQATLIVDDREVDREEFDDHISEGDGLVISGNEVRVTNRDVNGPVSDIAIDQVSGLIRLRVAGLGDDPANAEDDHFRLVASSTSQVYRIDGVAASFDNLADQLTVGDAMTYGRVNGVERFSLVNLPTPPVVGLVTEAYDPDGSAVAPEPEDGGTLTILTADGRVQTVYGPEATFRIDGRLATEEEFEQARTAGDQVSFQPQDTASGVGQELTLTNRDLTGDLGDITEGDNTYDVVGQAGVIYDNLPYTAGVLGGEDLYFADDDPIDLREFEDLLGLIDSGEQQAIIVVAAQDGATEHRLTFITEDD